MFDKITELTHVGLSFSLEFGTTPGRSTFVGINHRIIHTVQNGHPHTTGFHRQREDYRQS
jgi:hypothetical protein